ncbi:hypothetical protein ACEQ6C_17755 [Rhizobium ruizarguesonis]
MLSDVDERLVTILLIIRMMRRFIQERLAILALERGDDDRVFALSSTSCSKILSSSLCNAEQPTVRSGRGPMRQTRDQLVHRDEHI